LNVAASITSVIENECFRFQRLRGVTAGCRPEPQISAGGSYLSAAMIEIDLSGTVQNRKREITLRSVFYEASAIAQE
jgi:hypothetical protein